MHAVTLVAENGLFSVVQNIGVVLENRKIGYGLCGVRLSRKRFDNEAVVIIVVRPFTFCFPLPAAGTFADHCPIIVKAPVLECRL